MKDEHGDWEKIRKTLDEIKKFTTIHKQTRKFHKKKGKQTKRYYD